MATATAQVVTQKEISDYIGQHAAWKTRLHKALEDGGADLDAAAIDVDNQCAFGKWLIGVGASLAGDEHFRQARACHKEFHHAAAEIVRLIQAGKKDEAAASLAMKGDFFKTSADLTLAMMNWRKSLPG